MDNHTERCSRGQLNSYLSNSQNPRHSCRGFIEILLTKYCNVAGWQFWTLYVFCSISDMIDGWLAMKLQAESKTGSVLDSIADLSFVVCCAIKLLPALSIPSWLWIWSGIIVIIKIVNQILSLLIIKRFCFPHIIANKLTGFLLFIAVPTINWSIIPIAIVALIATFAAIQEGYLFVRIHARRAK